MEEKFRCFGTGLPLYEDYHDKEWGREVHDDSLLFELLTLEGAQAGLSWYIVLKKRNDYRLAFDNFDPNKVALYDDNKIASLLQNNNIIKNRLKILSTITNAKAIVEIIKKYGSFDKFIWSYVNYKPIVNHITKYADFQSKTPLSDKISKDLLVLGFKFVGSTIVYSFLQAIGMVNDHMVNCFVYKELLNQ